jgi:hypothetical protein
MATIGLWRPIDRFGQASDQAMKFSENPRDKIYLTVCFVCKDVAKPGQEHLRNYGGIVCYSCRAFWRRSHQASRCPKFICKRSNDCSITVATRRRCQRCRYQRCLIAGMNPEAVLNDDQKKVRFRKLLMKRQKQLARQMKARTMAERKATEWKIPEKQLYRDAYPDDSESVQSDASTDESFSTSHQVFPHTSNQMRYPQFNTGQTSMHSNEEWHFRPVCNQSNAYYQFLRNRGFFFEDQPNGRQIYRHNLTSGMQYRAHQEKNFYNPFPSSEILPQSNLLDVTHLYDSAMQSMG